MKAIRKARERVATGSTILQTSCGPIEYAEAGDRSGPPLLVIHGAGGGFDQGLDVAASLVPHGFRIIAISRFGYLRTALPRDASAIAQADAHAAVLDALHIPRAAVLGISAGGPSAMHLALSYPGRVSALVLMVPAAYTPRADSAAPQRMSALIRVIMELTLRADALFWLALRVAPRLMTRTILGTPPELVEHADRVERARVQAVLDHILPVSSRRRGLVNDAAVVSNLHRLTLERLKAPTLVISAEDDLYGTFAGSRYSAAHIRNARFVGYETGGHLLVGHHQAVTNEIVRFLRNAEETYEDATPALAFERL